MSETSCFSVAARYNLSLGGEGLTEYRIDIFWSDLKDGGYG